MARAGAARMTARHDSAGPASIEPRAGKNGGDAVGSTQIGLATVCAYQAGAPKPGAGQVRAQQPAPAKVA
jgi:hypothetical protein